MKHFNFLSNLLSLSKGSQSSDVSLDCRLTVGSPSVKCGSTLMRLAAISAFLLTIGVGNVRGTTTTISTTSGTSWTVDGRTWTAATNVTGGSSTYLSMTTNSSNITVNSTMSMDLSGTKTVTVTVGARYYGGKQASVTAKLVNSSGTTISNVGSAQPTSNKNASYTITLTPTDRTVTDAKVVIGVSGATNGSKYIGLYSFSIAYTGKPLITLSKTSITGLDYDYGDGPSAAQTFTVTGVELGANITITAPTNFEVCKTSGGTYTSSVSLTRSGTSVATTTIYVRLAAGKAVGNYGGASTYVTATSTNATTKNVSVSGTVSSSCANSVTINKGSSTNCSFSLSKSGAQASCDGVSTTVSITPNTGYGNPSVTQLGASAAPTITGTGTNSQTVSYAANTTGTSTINVSCSANTYTINLDNESATTAGTSSITATFNDDNNLDGTPAITVPEKTGWTFGGYYTAKQGGGTQIIAANGNVNASAGGGSTYTDASKNWKYADAITLYAKWTCTVTWSVNRATNVYSTQTVTYNSSGCKVASVPSGSDLDLENDYCGDKFMGWTSDENYVHGTSNLFTNVAGSPNITGDVTFYAVFADYAD